MIRFIGPVIVLAFGGAPAFGDEVFSAREFLYTRVFKMGSDLFPERLPVALSPQGIYLGGSFFIPPTGGPGPPIAQGVIRKYDAIGNEIWTRQIPARDVSHP